MRRHLPIMAPDDSSEEPKPEKPPLQKKKGSASAYGATFIIMLGLWCVLSGKFDPFHLVLGVLSCALVSYFSADLLFAAPVTGRTFRIGFGFVRYLPWLLYEILLSALHLLYLSFHPRMPELIDPQVLQFRTRLKDELAQVTFANSITLTPGTITIYVDFHRDFSVHAIDRVTRDALPGEMERRVARAFGEE
ncbi:MAG: protein MnhE [Deltaproteobacteria bacterium]|nr:protein MnhE [Deltaproteobacteria bacterium]